AFAGPGFAQTSVTACGQEVTGPAVLPADLDCRGFGGDAVTIHGGTLTMNGHSITGGRIGVYCDYPCKIIGPGLIDASTQFGADGFGTTVRMQQVDVTNVPSIGVQCFKACVLTGPATISGNGEGVRAGTVAKIRNMTISGNGNIAVDVAQNRPTG